MNFSTHKQFCKLMNFKNKKARQNDWFVYYMWLRYNSFWITQPRKQLLDELHKKQRELLVSEIDADLAYVKRVKSEKELELVYKEALQKFNKAKELGLLSQELIDVTTEFFANALEKFPFLNEDEDEDEEY